MRRNVQIQWNKGSTTASIGLQALRCVRKNEKNDCVFIYFIIFGYDIMNDAMKNVTMCT